MACFSALMYVLLFILTANLIYYVVIVFFHTGQKWVWRFHHLYVLVSVSSPALVCFLARKLSLFYFVQVIFLCVFVCFCIVLEWIDKLKIQLTRIRRSSVLKGHDVIVLKKYINFYGSQRLMDYNHKTNV